MREAVAEFTSVHVVPYPPTPSESYNSGAITGSYASCPHNNAAAERSPLQLIAIGVAGDHHSVSLKEELRPQAARSAPSQPNPQESWLPLTQSRNGNTICAVFHLLSSGIGIQALLLPLSFSVIGWTWGIISLSIGFLWQLYTIWLLVQLHESPAGVRCSRFILLSVTAFGDKLGKLLALFPVMYLSGGTCAMLIITGGGTMHRFFKLVCGNDDFYGGITTSCNAERLSGVEWFLAFTCMALLLAQLPHLNSIARVSLVGAISGITYCTLTWALSAREGRPTALSDHYQPNGHQSHIRSVGDILNALGIIALSFKGHNVILEIQGTLPSDPKRPTRVFMWRAVVISYIVIAICLYMIAIVGYWVYQDMISIHGIPTSAAMLTLFSESYGHKISKSVMGIILLLIVVNSLTSFQIYAMVVFDNLEFRYTALKNRPCPRWLRPLLRLLFGGAVFLVAVAFPFLGSLSPLIGGMTSPLTFAYPCFMWNAIEKPRRRSLRGCVNLGIGCLGIVLCVVLVAAAIWNIADKGLDANFFHPR